MAVRRYTTSHLVTAKHSLIANHTECLIQLKLELEGENRNKHKSVHLELSMSEFNEFFREMEKINNMLSIINWFTTAWTIIWSPDCHLQACKHWDWITCQQSQHSWSHFLSHLFVWIFGTPSSSVQLFSTTIWGIFPLRTRWYRPSCHCPHLRPKSTNFITISWTVSLYEAGKPISSSRYTLYFTIIFLLRSMMLS